jgi:hypothetical protein
MIIQYLLLHDYNSSKTHTCKQLAPTFTLAPTLTPTPTPTPTPQSPATPVIVLVLVLIYCILHIHLLAKLK